jgi:hypothetical protein
MDRDLLTWHDNAIAIDELIARASKSIDIIDANLRLQGWESRARAEALHHAMHLRNVHVRIGLLETQHLSSEFPRLFSLLRTHGHRLSITKLTIAPKPTRFIAVADRQHGIFRPVLVQSGGIVFFGNSAKSITYTTELEVIWQQGGVRVFPEAFGL